MFLELNPGHSRHLDVSDQAVGFREERRCQDISCGRERFDSVAQQAHEFSHGFAKGLIILDDRYQFTWHRGFQANSLTLTMAAPPLPSPSRSLCKCRRKLAAKQCQSPKRWLMLAAVRLGEGRLFTSTNCE